MWKFWNFSLMQSSLCEGDQEEENNPSSYFFSELQNKSTLLLEFAMFICLLITGFDTLYGFYLVFNGILPIDL